MADEATDLRGPAAGTAHCLLEEVVSYRAGDLPPERTGDFEAHLESCAACQRLVRDAATVLGGVDETVLAAGSRFRDIDRILVGLRRRVAERSVRSMSRPRQPSKRFWLPMAGVAAVVVLVAVLQLLAIVLHTRGIGAAKPPGRPSVFGPRAQPVRSPDPAPASAP